ncbi:MAG: CHASE2 domain-containing protein [Bdellovibrionota bacterium]
MYSFFRKWLLRGALAISIAFFGGLIYQTPWFQELEYRGLDLWFFLRGPQSAPEDVILVAIDEESYDALQVPMHQPWPRALHAQLLERLARAGAKRVVFDVIFGGPSGDEEADERLAKAFGLLPTAIGVEVAPVAGEAEREEVYLPFAPFQEQVAELSIVKKRTDKRHIRRFTPMFVDPGTGVQYRSLAQAGANRSENSQLPDENDLIWFYGPSRTVKTYSYSDALDEEFFLDEEFTDKTVFVGLALQTDTGPAQKDAFLTPFTSRGDTFGVEIHATAALNLIHRQWIKRAPFSMEAVYYGLATMLIALLLFALPPGYGLMLLFILITGWSYTAYSALTQHLIFVPGITLAAIIAPLIYLISTILSYLIARKRQRQTEEAFSYYLAPEMAKEVSQNPEALNLGGKTITATALFTDIADFTNISELMEAEDVVRMLNEYFSEVMDAIFETRGTLIKFIGDAVFALWGAPVAVSDHEVQTVATAIQIRERVVQFNKTGKYPKLHTRFGIHSGPMVVGNLGSQKRFDYTAIGDSVNLAARLEGLNKYFGTEILLSETVSEKLPNSFRLCPIGKVAVKGKSRAIAVSTVVPPEVPEEEIELWKWALEEFYACNWDQSVEGLHSLQGRASFFETAALLYINQIEIQRSRDTTEWSGAITFDSK